MIQESPLAAQAACDPPLSLFETKTKTMAPQAPDNTNFQVDFHPLVRFLLFFPGNNPHITIRTTLMWSRVKKWIWLSLIMLTRIEVIISSGNTNPSLNCSRQLMRQFLLTPSSLMPTSS